MAKAKGTTIAWKAAKDRNLHFAEIIDPDSDDLFAACPLVAQGGNLGYVLSREQAGAFLSDKKIKESVKGDIRFYLNNNIHLEGVTVIEVWLDSRPEWL